MAGESAPYRLQLNGADGVVLRHEDVHADTDEQAIICAIRRLREAVSVEVWSRSEWLCQVQTGRGLAVLTPRGGG